jgi:hypothetical protein
MGRIYRYAQQAALLACVLAISAQANKSPSVGTYAIEHNFICSGSPWTANPDVRPSRIISIHAIFRQLFQMSEDYWESSDPFVIFSNVFQPVSLERPPGNFYLQYMFHKGFYYSLSEVNNDLRFSTSFETLESWKSPKIEQRLRLHVRDALWRLNHCTPEIGGVALIKVHRDSFASLYAEQVFLISMNAQKDAFGFSHEVMTPGDGEKFISIEVRSSLVHPELLNLTLTRIDENLRFINDRFPGGIKPLSKLQHKRCEEPLI